MGNNKLTVDKFRMNKKHVLIMSSLIFTSLLNIQTIKAESKSSVVDNIEIAEQAEKNNNFNNDHQEEILQKLKDKLKNSLTKNMVTELLESDNDLTDLFEKAIVSHETANWSDAEEIYNNILINSGVSAEARKFISNLKANAEDNVIITEFLNEDNIHQIELFNDKEGKSADKYYQDYQDARYVSSRWKIALDFKKHYPSDKRVVSLINDAASQNLNYAIRQHDLGHYDSVIEYYIRILEEDLVSSSLKNKAEMYKMFAEKKEKHFTADKYYQNYQDARYISSRWKIALDFKEHYPSDKRVVSLINDAASQNLNYAIRQHQMGYYDQVLEYYDRVLQENLVDPSLKNQAKKYKDLAQKNTKLPTANQMYSDYQRATSVSERWELAQNFNNLYPNDSRVKTVINNAAKSNMSYAVRQHQMGYYDQVLEYYDRVLQENLVDPSLKNQAKKYKDLAQKNTKLPTANQIYSDYQRATSVSERWELAQNFNNLYPNDSRVKIVINNAAKSNMNYALRLQKSGNKLEATNYYDRIINEPIVSKGTRHLASVFLNQLNEARKPVVYVDPGHGGSDPGAVYGGITEERLNMEVTKYLIAELESMGYVVITSRTSNTTVGLTERAMEANNINADVFVSVHHNAGGRGRAHGIETYIYHRVASGFGQETNRNRFQMDDPRISESVRLADSIQNNLIRDTGFYDRGVKGNNFNVLRNTYIPAVLVELGYMDTPSELAIIKEAAYQKKAAQSIAQGIKRYFSEL